MLTGINLDLIKKLLRSEYISGIILVLCIVFSLAIANSWAGAWFNNLINTRVGFEDQFVQLDFTIKDWINDGLMAAFFLLVGLEIKRELTHGELSSAKKASLPIIAALGGMVLPAVFYSLINKHTLTAAGWGVPMATDIAFALAVLTVLGNRIPHSLKVFLLALAIVDDLGAIIVIGVFHTAQLHFTYLLLSVIVFVIQLSMNRLGIKKLYYYMVSGLLLWYFIHHAGIDATIAGVLTAIAIPAKGTRRQHSPLEELEVLLSKPVNYLIVPLFAVANTNIRFEMQMLDAFQSPMGLGIMSGLLLGKPIGIAISSWLAIKSPIASMPEGTTWPQIWGVGVLGGIGFTMSIFIALLSFHDQLHQIEAKFIILCSSAIAGACGYLLLRVCSPKPGKGLKIV